MATHAVATDGQADGRMTVLTLEPVTSHNRPDAVVASRHADAIDSALSDEGLASFLCSYSTAENMQTWANVGATDVVSVTVASGGVGSAAIFNWQNPEGAGDCRYFVVKGRGLAGPVCGPDGGPKRRPGAGIGNRQCGCGD
jgi:hypothetical protein